MKKLKLLFLAAAAVALSPVNASAGIDINGTYEFAEIIGDITDMDRTALEKTYQFASYNIENGIIRFTSNVVEGDQSALQLVEEDVTCPGTDVSHCDHYTYFNDTTGTAFYISETDLYHQMTDALSEAALSDEEIYMVYHKTTAEDETESKESSADASFTEDMVYGTWYNIATMEEIGLQAGGSASIGFNWSTSWRMGANCIEMDMVDQTYKKTTLNIIEENGTIRLENDEGTICFMRFEDIPNIPAQSLQIGETVSDDSIDLTLDSVEFLSEIPEDIAASEISYYPDSMADVSPKFNGQTLVKLSYHIRNKTKNALIIQDDDLKPCFQILLNYADGYMFSSYDAATPSYFTDGNSYLYMKKDRSLSAYLIQISPLEEKKITTYIRCPEQVELEKDAGLTATFISPFNNSKCAFYRYIITGEDNTETAAAGTEEPAVNENTSGNAAVPKLDIPTFNEFGEAQEDADDQVADIEKNVWEMVEVTEEESQLPNITNQLRVIAEGLSTSNIGNEKSVNAILYLNSIDFFSFYEPMLQIYLFDNSRNEKIMFPESDVTISADLSDGQQLSFAYFPISEQDFAILGRTIEQRVYFDTNFNTTVGTVYNLEKVLDALYKGEDVSFHIAFEDISFDFTVPSTGFKEACTSADYIPMLSRPMEDIARKAVSRYIAGGSASPYAFEIWYRVRDAYEDLRYIIDEFPDVSNEELISLLPGKWSVYEATKADLWFHQVWNADGTIETISQSYVPGEETSIYVGDPANYMKPVETIEEYNDLDAFYKTVNMVSPEQALTAERVFEPFSESMEHWLPKSWKVTDQGLEFITRPSYGNGKYIVKKLYDGAYYAYTNDPENNYSNYYAYLMIVDG